MTIMRKVGIGLAVVVAVILVIVIGSHHATTTKPTASHEAAETAPDQGKSRQKRASMRHLLNMRLSTIGAEISVGLPATLRMDDISTGETIYVRVTMEDVTKLSQSEGQKIIAGHSALHGYSTVYTMPVKLTLLGAINAAGTRTAPEAVLTSTDLNRFTIATHPGSDPIPSSSTVDDQACPGAEERSAIKTDQTVTWCIHAFASGTDDTPTGGQYETQTGTYATPITWASKRYAAPAIP